MLTGSADSVGYETMLQMPYSCVSVDQVSLPGTPTLRPTTPCLNHGSLRQSYLIGWITINPSTIVGRVRVRILSYYLLLPIIQQVIHRIVVVILCFGKHSYGQIYIGRTFIWSSLWPAVVVEQPMKTAGYLNITANQFHSLMVYVLPSKVFEKDNAPCHKPPTELEWFQEHNTKF